MSRPHLLKTIGIFPGQASEYAGMHDPMRGRTSHGAVVNRIRELTGRDITSGDGLADPLTAQLAVFGASVSYWDVSADTIDCCAVAGHSLGFYAAVHAAGALPFDDCVMTIVEVQKAIGRIFPRAGGAMASILGLREEQVESLCAAAGRVSVANVNSATQIVISGMQDAVREVSAAAVSAGALSVRELPVSFPLHSGLMQGIEGLLVPFVRTLRIVEPKIPVMSHIDTCWLDAEGIGRTICNQLGRKVRWRDAVQTLAADGGTRFFEIGPSDVLSKLVRWIVRDAEVTTAEEVLKCQVA